jgi:hypothetical protein
VRAWLAAQPRDRGFGNGRLARNLFEAAVANQATRLVGIDHPTDEQLTTLVVADIPDIAERAAADLAVPASLQQLGRSATDDLQGVGEGGGDGGGGRP